VKSVYIAATEASAGKTTLAVGLCRALREKGVDAGYFKPIGAAGQPQAGLDEDAVFATEALGLPDDPRTLCPLRLTESAVEGAEGAHLDSPLDVLRSAYARVAERHAVLVCEGLGEVWQGRFAHVSGADVVAALDLPVLLVARFAGTRQLDDVCYVKDVLRARLQGVVFTMVPETRLDAVEHDYGRFLAANGVRGYGVIPANRQLAAVSVKAIAAGVGGTFVAGTAAADRLAEGYLIGAMGPEHALAYFERTPNKVVVVGADRDDLILAALRSSTVAVVLTGTAPPSPDVVRQAEQDGVALIAVPQDTVFAADALRHLFGRISVHDRSRVDLIAGIVAERVDVDRLVADLS
jgi:hypothetical protein